MKIIDATESSGSWRRLFTARCAIRSRLRAQVHGIVDRVRKGGDHALDGIRAPVRRHARRARSVAPRKSAPGPRRVAPDVRRAIRQAARHIARVAFRQIPKHWDLAVAPGVSIEQRVEPLARVGCYVPGGRFPLPSSLLMTAVPARVAGVREVIVVCPRPEPAVMAAALEAGVTRLFRIGGAHGVAALAFGTATDPARGQDRRPRQPVRRRGQGVRRRRLRDRLLRGPDRNRHRGGLRARRTGSPPISSRRPSTIRTRDRS